MATERDVALAKLSDLACWVGEHGQDVDPCVFRACCDEVLTLAQRAVSPGRWHVPSFVLGRGVLTLDLACSFLGVPVPHDVLGARASDTWPLPGLREYQSCREEET